MAIPNQNVTVTPVPQRRGAALTPRWCDSASRDTQVIEDDAAPVRGQDRLATYDTAGMKTVTMQIEYLVAADEFVSHAIRVNAAPWGPSRAT